MEVYIQTSKDIILDYLHKYINLDATKSWHMHWLLCTVFFL